ncbi:MAG: hypothetical protein NTV14_10230 [Coprothermobacterota bacterium]|nr:hypothetical protein [Coprothermobacterota bacterium]
MRLVERIPALIRELYATISQLAALFPGRRFTLDGHLVGSLGEVVAAYRYNLVLFAASTRTHDAQAPDGRGVQIKVTQGKYAGLRAKPEHLLVLHISEQGEFFEVFNGPGSLAWAAAGKMQKNGQRQISLARLRDLMRDVLPEQTIKTVGP